MPFFLATGPHLRAETQECLEETALDGTRGPLDICRHDQGGARCKPGLVDVFRCAQPGVGCLQFPPYQPTAGPS